MSDCQVSTDLSCTNNRSGSNRPMLRRSLRPHSSPAQQQRSCRSGLCRCPSRRKTTTQQLEKTTQSTSSHLEPASRRQFSINDDAGVEQRYQIRAFDSLGKIGAMGLRRPQMRSNEQKITDRQPCFYVDDFARSSNTRVPNTKVLSNVPYRYFGKNYPT